jgi:hypothetical protein
MAKKRAKRKPLPKINDTLKQKEKIESENLTLCMACNKYKRSGDFYVSYNENRDKSGYLPFCKDCLKAMCLDRNGNIDKKKFLEMLKTIDKPYIQALYRNITARGGDVVGKYIRTTNMKQYRGLTWDNGDLHLLNEEESEVKPQMGLAAKTSTGAKKDNIGTITTEAQKFKNFKVTNEMIALFGTGYSDEEYFQMWNKYEFLKANYVGDTSMHTEALVTYVRYKVKEEMAIVANLPGDAKTWGDLAMKQAERAKINPNQFSKADLQGGLTTIGEIAQAVEQNVDIIPILPQFRYRPNDAVDFCIWNYINYARDLEGKPLVEYKDVYKFYDKMKDAYIASTGDPYGIFDGDPTEGNREKVEKFIQLPKEYYEEGEE